VHGGLEVKMVVHQDLHIKEQWKEQFGEEKELKKGKTLEINKCFKFVFLFFI